ncbi:MAG: calcium-binding protein, partial [Alphaproteobacteria bacterium]
MPYTFNQAYVPIATDVLDTLPHSLSVDAQYVINQYVIANPEATQKDVLEALYDDVVSGSLGVEHEDLYLFVFSQMSEVVDGALVPKSVLGQNEQSAWLWVDGAIGVNTNDNTFFSNYIRDQTIRQFELRYGEGYKTEAEIEQAIQDASDEIAINFVKDILNIDLPLGISNESNELPPAERIGGVDAAGVAANVFRDAPVDGELGNFSPWAGTILFPFLGVGDFTRDWLLTADTNDNKKIAGTYDLISVAQTAWDVARGSWIESTDFLSTLTLAAETLDALNDTLNNGNLGRDGTLDLLASLREEANTFFQEYYGVPDVGQFQIGDDLPLYGPDLFGIDFLLRPNYIVGTLSDDAKILGSSSAPFTGTFSGADIINAGLGNDVIMGSSGDDLIDGAEGADTLDYRGLGHDIYFSMNALSLAHDAGARYVGTAAWVIEEYTPDPIAWLDYIYNVETIIGSNYSDVFKIIYPRDGITISGAGGTDIMDLSEVNGSAGITVDVHLGIYGLMNFNGFEHFIGSDYDDVFIDAVGEQKYEGGGDLDEVDFSNSAYQIAVNLLDGEVESRVLGDVGFETDKVSEIEGFTGTGEDDYFYAAAGLTNIMFNGAGNSSYIDDEGNIIEVGRDVVDFTLLSSVGITVNYANATDASAIDESGGSFALFNIEQINGTSVKDVINGGGGDDWFLGEGGNDEISGGGGNDYLNGGAGADILNGGAGDDIYYYASVSGGVSTPSGVVYETVMDSSGDDVIYFGGGFMFNPGAYDRREDLNQFRANGVRIDGLDTIETIEFSDGASFDAAGLDLEFSQDNFVLAVDEDGNYIPAQSLLSIGTSGNDVIQGTTNYDHQISGGEGMDTLTGNVGDDLLAGGEGADIINGGVGDDALYAGGDGTEVDQLNGGAGNDFLYGSGGGDILNGGAGFDRIEGLTNDILLGGVGEDQLFSDGDGAILDGGEGNDYLSGIGSNISYIASAGTDVILDHGDNSTLVFSEGSAEDLSFHQATNGSLVITKSDDDLVIVQNYFDGNELEFISFDGGNTIDSIALLIDGGIEYYQSDLSQLSALDYALELPDIYTGGMEDNIYIALADQDEVYSGDGANSFIFGRSETLITVTISSDLDDQNEVIVLENETSFDNVQLIYEDEVMSLHHSGGEIVIENALEDGQSEHYVVEVNGIQRSLAEIGVTIVVTDDHVLEGDLNGYSIHDTIYVEGEMGGVHGLSGDDTLTGDGGLNRLYGDEGNDTLNGGGGNDELYGGLGNDVIHDGEGDDIIRGDELQDNGTGNVTSPGADTFYDGQGNDLYYVDSSDTIHLGQGENVIRLQDLSYDFQDKYNHNPEEEDDLGGATLVIDGVSSIDDLQFIRTYDFDSHDINDQYDYTLHYNGNSVQLDIYQYYTSAPQVYLSDVDLSISLADIPLHTVLTPEWEEDNPFFFFSDELRTFPQEQVITLAEGTEGFTIGVSLDDGDARFNGNASGNYVSKANDEGILVAYGYGGNDFIYAGNGDSELYGGLGDDTLEGGLGDDLIEGNEGNDTIAGGDGDDVLYAGAGDDIVAGYDGDDELYGGEGDDILSGGNGNDTGYFSGVFANYQFSDLGRRIEIKDTVGNDGTDILSSVDYLVFSDMDFSAASLLSGTEDGDTLNGTEGNDTIIGGGGDDILNGGAGDDTYLFSIGDGNNTITEDSGFDVLQLGGSITLDDLVLTQVGNDLDIQIASGFVVKDFYSGDENKIVEQIAFADGSTFDLTVLLNDTLIGTSVVEIFDGGIGIDTVDYSASVLAVDIDLSAG